MLKWVDSNFNSVTEGGVGHNTSIQFVDGKFVNTVKFKSLITQHLILFPGPW